eukprot:TRINITY_DN125_c0_g1_i1.p1 TRINITY_DN125_c0_g1~~TRINITY_DN125_c0_g1_i1.p1  ORF type:complete len:123 (+),score=33.91 TRINITY_DN125_c0_g1_i1:63-431(+)
MSIRFNYEKFQGELPIRIVPRGIPGIAIYGGIIGSSLLGMWVMIKSHRKRAAEDQEQWIGHVNIMPLLQAEEDRRFLRTRKLILEDEEKLAEAFPGEIIPGETPYNTTWKYPAGSEHPYRNW